MSNDLNWQTATMAWFDGLPTSHHAYALVDMANVHRLKRETLARLQARQSLNVLMDDRPDAQEASAWLMPLIKDIQGRKDLATSLSWASNSACVTWLSSNLPHQSLARAIHQRTAAELPDHYRVLLRCYDPRVLPELHAILTPSQAESFWGLNGTWCYVDRRMAFHQINLPPASISFESPLQLSQAQADALLDASEVDRVMPELIQESAEAFLALQPGERAAFTRRALRRANLHGLESFGDRVIFCILALELGEKFDDLPEWKPALQLTQTKRLPLTKAIAQVLQK